MPLTHNSCGPQSNVPTRLALWVYSLRLAATRASQRYAGRRLRQICLFGAAHMRKNAAVSRLPQQLRPIQSQQPRQSPRRTKHARSWAGRQSTATPKPVGSLPSTGSATNGILTSKQPAAHAQRLALGFARHLSYTPMSHVARDVPLTRNSCGPQSNAPTSLALWVCGLRMAAAARASRQYAGRRVRQICRSDAALIVLRLECQPQLRPWRRFRLTSRSRLWAVNFLRRARSWAGSSCMAAQTCVGSLKSKGGASKRTSHI